MAIAKKDLYTVDFINNLPESERAELINGEIYFMAPPKTDHQRIVSFLNRKIGNYIELKSGSCEVFPAPFAVFLNNDDYNYVEPDISVICDKNKLDEKGCNGAPDWIIEILSPSSRQMDKLVKLIKYKNSGVREYWIVDPEKKEVIVYDFENNKMFEYTFSDKVPVNIYSDLEIDFSNINL